MANVTRQNMSITTENITHAKIGAGETLVGSPLTRGTVQTSAFRRNWNIVRELGLADFRLKYHDSALGYIWSMLNPLMMFGVYYFVFTRIFRNTIPNFPLFLLVGIVNYTFFQDCTFQGMLSVASKAGIMKKIYFPRTLLVYSAASTALLSYVINTCVLCVLIYVIKGFTPLALLSFIPMISLLFFSLGVALVLATLFAFFRDMAQIWGVLVLVLFWLSPVVFNPETLPAPISTVVYFNPLARIFVLMRYCLLYDYFNLRFIVMTIVYSAVSFVIGLFVFTRYQDKLPELF
jgi:ABC-type polysaccharide/polyol phosphate export permease